MKPNLPKAPDVDVPDLPDVQLPELPSLPDAAPEFVRSVLDGALDAVPLVFDVVVTLV